MRNYSSKLFVFFIDEVLVFLNSSKYCSKFFLADITVIDCYTCLSYGSFDQTNFISGTLAYGSPFAAAAELLFCAPPSMLSLASSPVDAGLLAFFTLSQTPFGTDFMD